MMTPTEKYNQELCHYGVKGMKWGVRRERNSAKKLVKQYANLSKRGDYKGIRKLRRSDRMYELRSNTELKNAVTKRRKAEDAVNKLRDEYYNNPKLMDKYQRIVAKDFAKEQGISFDEAYAGYKYDDWDNDESYQKYVDTTGVGAKEYKALREASIETRNVCKKIVDEYLGDYGDTPIKQKHANTTSARNFIASQLEFDTYVKDI